MNISGGSVGRTFMVNAGALANISGGFVTSIQAEGSVNVSGGVIGVVGAELFEAFPGSEITLSGGDIDFEQYVHDERRKCCHGFCRAKF